MKSLSLPGMSFINGSAGAGMDVLVGGAIGMAGMAGIKFVYNKMIKNTLDPKIAGYVSRVLPAASGALTGAALYILEKKTAKAKSHALGALAAGVFVNIWDEIRMNVPQLADLVSIQLEDYPYAGYLVDDSQQGYAGYIVEDASNPNLAELTSINLEDDADF